MKIKLVKAVEEDCDFLAKVCRDAKIVYSDIMPESFEKQAKRFETKGIPDIYDVYVIQKQNKKIGFIGVTELNKNTVYLVALYLLLDYQGKGYGSRVVNKLISDYKKNDYEEIIILVHKDANWAINFYKSVNFEIVTNDIETIKGYANGIMKKYAITSTILMRQKLKYRSK